MRHFAASPQDSSTTPGSMNSLFRDRGHFGGASDYLEGDSGGVLGANFGANCEEKSQKG